MQQLGKSKDIILLILLKIQNLWNLINLLIKKIYENILFMCLLWFFKVQWVKENQGVTFLVVSPKDAFV
jgi:hypothetical protein